MPDLASRKKNKSKNKNKPEMQIVVELYTLPLSVDQKQFQVDSVIATNYYK